MAINSMTGFARADGALGGVVWGWEIKSVNNKGFDLRIRLPTGFDNLEPAARIALAEAFKRGSLQVSLTVEDDNAAGAVSINQAVLDSYLALSRELQTKLGGSLPSIEALLGMKGVVEAACAPREATLQTSLEEAVLGTLHEAIATLLSARGDEGEKLADILALQLARIAELLDKAENHSARQPQAIRLKLDEQVAKLVDVTKLDEQRLLQEVALLVAKSDIQEELDRLSVHVKAARTLLQTGEPVGRKFDFLAQEFNREANTLCSKSNDSGLTSLGLDLKTVIDQMREQVQNIE